jgi:hypothetical protein
VERGTPDARGFPLPIAACNFGLALEIREKKGALKTEFFNLEFRANLCRAMKKENGFTPNSRRKSGAVLTTGEGNDSLTNSSIECRDPAWARTLTGRSPHLQMRAIGAEGKFAAVQPFGLEPWIPTLCRAGIC